MVNHYTVSHGFKTLSQKQHFQTSYAADINRVSLNILIIIIIIMCQKCHQKVFVMVLPCWFLVRLNCKDFDASSLAFQGEFLQRKKIDRYTHTEL